MKDETSKTRGANGHFSREGDAFTWERTDRVEVLKAAAGLEAAPA